MTNIQNATVWIKDTGKLRTSSTSAAETDSVSGGATVTLSSYVNSIKCEESAFLNSKGSPFIYENNDSSKQSRYAEVDQVGMDIPNWTMELVFKCDDATALQVYGQVMRLARTKGYKQFYASNIVEYYAYEEDYYGNDSKSANTVLSYINVRVLRATSDFDANGNKMTVKLEMVETE